MDGPSPENGGKMEACSLHIGVTDLDSTFDQACPDFNKGIMSPYKEFLDHVPGTVSDLHCEEALLEMTEILPVQHC